MQVAIAEEAGSDQYPESPRASRAGCESRPSAADSRIQQPLPELWPAALVARQFPF